MHMHLRDSQQPSGQLDCCSLILIARPALLHKAVLWWNAVCLSCSLHLDQTNLSSIPATPVYVIMADPTLDAPEVPILLLGDAEVGKSTFLS